MGLPSRDDAGRGAPPETVVLGTVLADRIAPDPLEEETMLAALEARMFGTSRRLVLSRYELRQRLGRGGAGDVHLAWDPELAREVAIKLLRPVRGPGGSAARRRFLREAQSIAKLDHDNVVTIFDVGDFAWSDVRGDDAPDLDTERGIFIVMERVTGVDLARWLDAGRHAWREVLEVFRQAGEGLAAAHHAGIVHRDFKPGNVLVATDGRAKVADFGLALMDGLERTDAMPADAAALSGELSESTGRLTEAGTVMGTPLYMAPEQHRGHEIDPRADVYAFCASLYRGLFGRPAFSCERLDLLYAAKMDGPPRPPRSSGVPPHIVRAVLRGLAPDPADRWSSMEVLLGALRERGPRSRRGWMAGGIGLAVVGALLLGHRGAASLQPCRPGEHTAGMWGPMRSQALAASGKGSASLDRVRTEIDAFVDAWHDAYQRTCDEEEGASRRTSVRACLHDELAEIDGLVDRMRGGEGPAIVAGLEALGELRPPSACLDVEPISAPVRVALADATAVAERDRIRGRLGEVRTLQRLGRYAEGMVLARDATADADRLGDPVVLALAYLRQGDVEEKAGEFESARTSLERAYFLSRAIDEVRVAVEAAGVLTFIHGHRLRDLDTALEWERHARALLAERPDPQAEAELDDQAGTVRIDLGHYEEALSLYRRTQAYHEAHSGVLSRATAYNNVATALDYLGRHAEALVEYEKAISLKREFLGSEHPAVANALYNMGNSTAKLGDLEAGVSLHREALEIRLRTLGETHARTGHSLANLAAYLTQLGRLDEAEGYQRRAIVSLRAAYGADHPHVAGATSNLASLLERRGSNAAALERYEEALALAETAHGFDHPMTILITTNLARVHGRLGHSARAIELYERAIDAHRQQPGPEDVAGDAYFGLAQEWLLVHGDRERARVLSDEAISHYRVVAHPGHDRADDVRAWQSDAL